MCNKPEDFPSTSSISETNQDSSKANVVRRKKVYKNPNGKKLPKIIVELVDDASDDEISERQWTSFYEEELDSTGKSIIIE